MSIKRLQLYKSVSTFSTSERYEEKFSAINSFVKNWIWFWLFAWIICHNILSIKILEIQSTETEGSFANPHMPTVTIWSSRRTAVKSKSSCKSVSVGVGGYFFTTVLVVFRTNCSIWSVLHCFSTDLWELLTSVCFILSEC